MVRTAATTIKTTGGKSTKGGGFKNASNNKSVSRRFSHGSGNRVLQQPLPSWQRPILHFTKTCSSIIQDSSTTNLCVIIPSQATGSGGITSEIEEKISPHFVSSWEVVATDKSALPSGTDSSTTSILDFTDEYWENHAAPKAKISTIKHKISSTLQLDSVTSYSYSDKCHEGERGSNKVKHLQRALERKRARDPVSSSPDTSDQEYCRQLAKKHHIRRNTNSDSSIARICRQSYDGDKNIQAELTSCDSRSEHA